MLKKLPSKFNFLGRVLAQKAGSALDGVSEVPRDCAFERVNALPRFNGTGFNDVGGKRWGNYTYQQPCEMPPRKLQVTALEVLDAQSRSGHGAFLAMPVGAGKTLVGFLAPQLYGIRGERTLLFTYASLVRKTILEFESYSWHYRIEMPYIMSWEELSNPGFEEQLPSNVELIVADEVQALKDPTSVRTKRFSRLFQLYEGRPHLVAMSGSVTTNSIKDYAHILEQCLHEFSPLPRPGEPDEAPALDFWARAIDNNLPGISRLAPGPLSEWTPDGQTTIEAVRLGYRARLSSTAGIVMGDSEELGAGLEITMQDVASMCYMPEIHKSLRELNATATLPDGTDCSDPLDFSRAANTLGLGYYNQWEWPGGIVDEFWLGSRRKWHNAVSKFLASCYIPGLDSPALVQEAAMQANPDLPDYVISAWFAGWYCVYNRTEPPVRGVLTRGADEICAFISDWLLRAGNSVIWSPSPVIGQHIAKSLHLPYYGDGDLPKNHFAAVMSMQAHGKGQNLQHYNNNLILRSPANGATMEQLLGRTHRFGQLADNVHVTVLVHHPAAFNAWKKALESSRYIYQTTGINQKLLLATYPDGKYER